MLELADTGGRRRPSLADFWSREVIADLSRHLELLLEGLIHRGPAPSPAHP
jgi:hypothetical protein